MTLKEISEEFGIYYGTLLNWKKNRKKLINFLQSFEREEVEKILNKKESKEEIIVNLSMHDYDDSKIINLPKKYEKAIKEILTINRISKSIEIDKKASECYKTVVEFLMSDFFPLKDEVRKFTAKCNDGNFLINAELRKMMNINFLVDEDYPIILFPIIDRLKTIGKVIMFVDEKEIEIS